MILGIGMDLCGIDRMAKALERPRFLERVFTAGERARLEAAPPLRRREIAAGLFAAKEAAAKALGTGFAGLGPWDVEILPDDSGAPRCTLLGGAAERAEALAGGGTFRMHVTITHEEGMAAAMAILEKD